MSGAGISRTALAVTAAAGAAGLAGLAMAASTPAAVRPLSAKANELAYNVTTFYCSVFGHEAGGMKGTLTVAKRRS